MNITDVQEFIPSRDGLCDCGNQCTACGDCAYVVDGVAGEFCGPDTCLTDDARREADADTGPVFTELADAQAYAERTDRIAAAESYDDLAGTGAGTLSDPTQPVEAPVWRHAAGLVAFRLA